MKDIDFEEEINLLGRGWKFPPVFNYHSNKVEMVHGLQDIKESLVILMRTRVGERIMERHYGSDLTPLAFQQLDLNLETFMVNNIKQTIMEHEPRVEVLEVKLQMDEEGGGGMDIHISYSVKQIDVMEVLHYRYHPIFNK